MGNRVPPTKSFNTVKHSNREKRIKKQQKLRALILGMLAITTLLILMLIIFAVCSIVASFDDETTEPPVENEIIYQQFPEKTDAYQEGALIIVNKKDNREYDFPSNPNKNMVDVSKVERAKADDGKYVYRYDSVNNPLMVNRDAFDAFEAMMLEYYKYEEDDTVWLQGAYRSWQDQKELELNSASAPAGYSDHHTGYLLTLKDSVSSKELDLDGNHWIAKNAHKYGFVLRYPDSGQHSDHTGIQGYTNCIRYVGIAHATYMYENDLCLEEYVTLLASYTQDSQLQIRGADGNLYSIYYVAKSSDAVTSFNVPKNYEYEISGDNVGGFIVTVNLNAPIVQDEPAA